MVDQLVQPLHPSAKQQPIAHNGWACKPHNRPFLDLLVLTLDTQQRWFLVLPNITCIAWNYCLDFELTFGRACRFFVPQVISLFGSEEMSR